ncbi:MAG: mercury resistance system periplasmic binding protein MerP [Thiobacillus sp.]
MNQSIWLAVVLVALSTPVLAAQKTVTLGVPGMTCGTCPITVKKALIRVDGVILAKVDYDKKQAVVTFDDARANVDQLKHATADAGYPSSIKGGAQ